jgi:hypothetical protein
MVSLKKRALGRRAFLKTAQFTTLMVASGVVWRALEQGVFSTGEGAAYEPWKTWRSDKSEGSLELVRAAILAANPHNSQPWLFCVSQSRIDLFADPSRNLGAVDPYLRQMYVGLGCTLENLLLAAQANGYAYQLTLLPKASDSTHAARVDLLPSQVRVSDLYDAIPQRHTNRAPYDTSRQVSAATLSAMRSLGNDLPNATIFWFTSDEARRRVGNLIVRATEAIIADKEQTGETAKWIRLSWQDVQRYRDGITLDAMGIPTSLRAIAKILPPSSPEQNDQIWLQTTRDKQVATAAAFGIIAIRDIHNKAQRIQGGRLWQRMHLWATSQGLALQPLDQISERAERETSLGSEPKFGKALEELIGEPSWQALLLFRVGYPTLEALASPRRALADVLR